MKTLPLRSLVVAVAAVSAIGATVTASTASADTSTDPVTSGTTTLSVPISLFTGSANKDYGFYALPTTPATVSFDPNVQRLNARFAVTGGDASVNTFYGTLKQSGGILVGSVSMQKNVQLSKISFNIEDDTVTVKAPALTPGGATSVVMFDALGSHETIQGTPETFKASDLQLDPKGAAYLNSAFSVSIFKGGMHLGSFSTTFTNTNDA